MNTTVNPFDEVEQELDLELDSDETVIEDDAQIEPHLVPAAPIPLPTPTPTPAPTSTAPFAITGDSNPQGLSRSSAPDEAELKEQQAERNRIAANATRIIEAVVPPMAMYRGNDPVTGEALYAYDGQVLLKSEIPKGTLVEPIPTRAALPVV